MLKRLLLIFVCIIGGISGVAFFYWQQATQLPNWYTNSSTNEPTIIAASPTANPLPEIDQKQIQQTRKQVLKKVSQLNSKDKGEVQLNAEEVNALIFSEISNKTDKSELAQAVKGTNAQIEDGKISAGAVIDLKEISQKELPSQEQAALDEFLSKLPPNLRNQPLYVGIEGKPTIRDRQFSFDDSAQIKLGNISFPLAEVAQSLGIPPEQLNQQISQQLKNLPLKLDDVEIVGDRLVLRSSPTAQKGS